MKQEIADLWTEALRSGDYEQATGTLLKTDSGSGDTIGHCCLGVLCEIAIKQGVKVEKSEPRRYVDEIDGETYISFGGVTFDDRDDLLPESVKQWAGMKSADGSMEHNELQLADTLAELNDSGKSFLSIARIIEENVEEL